MEDLSTMSTPISNLGNNVPSYQEIVTEEKTIQEPQQLGPPPPIVQNMPIHKNHDLREQINVHPKEIPSEIKPKLEPFSKELQHEIMCIIASNFILYSDPVQNILNSSVPNTNKLLRIMIRGIFIAISFVILRKTTLQFIVD